MRVECDLKKKINIFFSFEICKLTSPDGSPQSEKGILRAQCCHVSLYVIRSWCMSLAAQNHQLYVLSSRTLMRREFGANFNISFCSCHVITQQLIG